MNTTGEADDYTQNAGYLAIASVLTTALGLTIFLENLGVIAIITKLHVKQVVKKDANDIIVHTLFVCANDMCSGFTLFVLGLISVTNEVTAHFCAYTIFLSLSLQIMSQGNITCICVQRYIGARNIRSLTQGRQRYRTLTLMLVNVLIGGGSLASSIAQSYKTVKPTYLNNDYCSFSNVLAGRSSSIGIVFYNIGFIVTILADILCFLTIRKLRTEINAVVQPDGTSTTLTSSSTQTTNTKSASTNINSLRSSSSNTNVSSIIVSSTNMTATNPATCARTSVKLRQQRAIFTMLFILITLNVSVIPTLFGYTMVMLGWQMTMLDQRLLYLSIFFNSSVNPIIIATRVQDIRLEVVGAARRVYKFIFRRQV